MWLLAPPAFGMCRHSDSSCALPDLGNRVGSRLRLQSRLRLRGLLAGRRRWLGWRPYYLFTRAEQQVADHGDDDNGQDSQGGVSATALFLVVLSGFGWGHCVR